MLSYRRRDKYSLRRRGKYSYWKRGKYSYRRGQYDCKERVRECFGRKGKELSITTINNKAKGIIKTNKTSLEL